MTDRPALSRNPRAHLLALVAALGAALLPMAALAQAKKAPTPTPAPRAATAAPAASPMVGRWELGFGVGLATPLETGIDTGFKSAFQGFYGLASLTPTTTLQLGGSAGWSYNGGPLRYALHSFDLLPVGRLRAQVAPSLVLFGDFGLGLAVLRTSQDVPLGPGGALVPQTTTDTSAIIRLGGGLGFDLGRQWSLSLEPAFCIYARSSSVTQFTLLLGALYRP